MLLVSHEAMACSTSESVIEVGAVIEKERGVGNVHVETIACHCDRIGRGL